MEIELFYYYIKNTLPHGWVSATVTDLLVSAWHQYDTSLERHVHSANGSFIYTEKTRIWRRIKCKVSTENRQQKNYSWLFLWLYRNSAQTNSIAAVRELKSLILKVFYGEEHVLLNSSINSLTFKRRVTHYSVIEDFDLLHISMCM